MKHELVLADEAVELKDLEDSKLWAQHVMVKKMEERGIENLLDIIELMEVIVVAGAKVFKDGKVSFKDMVVHRDLLKSAKVMVDVIRGAKEIPSEIKDLSGEEVSELASRVLGLIDAFKDELADR